MAVLAAPVERGLDGFGAPVCDDWEAEWTHDSMTVSNTDVGGPQVEVRDTNSKQSKVVITQAGTVLEEQAAKGGATKQRHIQRRHCRPNCSCMQCLLEAMDVARVTGKDERIGQGSQGLVFKFLGPGKKWYVRKDVAISQHNKQPPSVVTKLAQASDEHAKHEVAASIIGEMNRLFLQGEHIVQLHGMRLYSPYDRDRAASSAVCLSFGSGLRGGAAPPDAAPPATPSASTAASTPQTLEFVMEYVDFTLQHLAKLASLVEQRVLNRVVARHPPGFPVGPPTDTLLSSVAAAALLAGLVTLAVSTKGGFSWSIPYYKGHFPGTRRRCGCMAPPDPGEDVPKGLMSRSDSGVLPELVITNIFKQAACGLRRLEQWCLVHRDIKGSNMLVSRSGLVKIADFGTSKRGKRETTAADPQQHRRDREVTITTPFGMSTRIYQAPELAALPSLFDSANDLSAFDGPPSGLLGGDEMSFGLDAVGLGADSSHAFNLLEALGRQPRARSITSATDVWSLGLTMLVIATPSKEGPWPPQFVDGADSFYHPSCVKDFRVPAVLSPGLRELLARCLSCDPTRRPSAAELLAHPSLPQRCPCKDDQGPQHGGRSYSIAPFLEKLLVLTHPAEEAARTEATLLGFGLSAVDRSGPQEYDEWCDETLRHLEALHATYAPTHKTPHTQRLAPPGLLVHDSNHLPRCGSSADLGGGASLCSPTADPISPLLLSPTGSFNGASAPRSRRFPRAFPEDADAAHLPSHTVAHPAGHAPRVSLRRCAYLPPSVNLATGEVEVVGVAFAPRGRAGGRVSLRGVGAAESDRLPDPAPAVVSETPGFIPTASGGGGAAPLDPHRAAFEETAARVKTLTKLYRYLKAREKLMHELEYECPIPDVSSGSEASADPAAPSTRATKCPAGDGAGGAAGSTASDGPQDSYHDDEDVAEWLAEQHGRCRGTRGGGGGHRTGSPPPRQQLPGRYARYERSMQRIVDEEYEKHDRRAGARPRGGARKARSTTQSFHDALADTFASQPSSHCYTQDAPCTTPHMHAHSDGRQQRRRTARVMHHHHHSSA
eukprot:TRINITY_DN1643_c0_g1_i3.p1 TRINITY_DN1643_c0_g1~~TRINITY_DN1643_c0_g1_i3.p1  ORF type:complete len:1057 (+),score=291.14 TRINITY_DN1643_c0_g1_i3:178-3348(+)